jgi:23S rRNA (adenine2503-C2)-methyltransferase
MRFTGRVTACLSSQAGCAMGCVFCATGQRGFTRQLSVGEIVAQAVHVQRLLRAQGERLRNVVLMGMGEPLHNYDAVMKAVDILRDPSGLALGAKKITLSTVGVVPGIRRMADEARPIYLAVSLHAATQAERLALVPVAKRWPLDELMDACRYYVRTRGGHIFFEWTLIERKNDSAEHAHAVGQLLRGLDSQVNLIPLNPTAGYDGAPTRSDAAKQFQAILAQYGLPSTVRQRRGIDIAAGCGQLAANLS